jgi:hypothetical protein
MKPRVYIETTVVSYQTARVSRNLVVAGHQQSTNTFWDLLGHKLDPYVSALVVKECAKGDPSVADKRMAAIVSFPVLGATEKASKLANVLLDTRGIPTEAPEDALHIAIAATSGMDYIVTWNFTHINNPFTITRIRETILLCGYKCPEIVSPEAFLGDEI